MTDRFKYEEVVFREDIDEETGETIRFISPQIRDDGVVIYDGKEVEDVKFICDVMNGVNNENVLLKKLISSLLNYYRKCPVRMTPEELEAFKMLKEMGL